MKYTISRLADKKVEKDLNKIKSIIIKEINPVSIILFGGFGKGEGSFEIKNNEIISLNDYDLYVIVKKRINDKRLEEISLKCSNKLGYGGLEFAEHPNEEYDEKKFFHVDIRQIEYNKLNKLLPTQRTFELKRSKIIYGENVLDKIPDVKVPISDAIRLLFNKMHHLLLSKDNNKKIKIIHINKAFLDCCTALLIFENKLKAGYTERNKIFQKSKFPKELKKKVNWATKFRLKTDFNKIKNINEKWEDARCWVEYSLAYIIKNYLNIKVSDWKEIAKICYKRLPYIYFSDYLPSKFLFPSQYYLNIKYFLTLLRKGEFNIKPLIRWRDSGLILAIAMILYVNNEKEESRKYLKKLTNKTEPLKNRLLEYYGVYYSQKLI